MNENKGNTYNINSVQRALSVLKVFIPKNEPLSLMDISIKLSLNKSTTLRMLSTLKEAGFLKMDAETKKYTLGISALQLGLCALDSLSLASVSKPMLTELANKSGCVVHLGIFENEKVIVLSKIFPTDRSFSVHLMSKIGGLLPVYCTGIGLLFLASQPDKSARRILKDTELIKYTQKTITNIDAIIARLAEIRKQGYAINDGEHEEGIVSFCYPIYDHLGTLTAALSVGKVREVVQTNEEAEFLKGLAKDAAEKISKELGYYI